MSDLHLFIQQIVAGFDRGSEYALWAVGYGLVYQVLGLMHFAHGDTLLLGLYVAFGFMTAMLLPLPIALVVVLALAGAIAVVIERGVYRPLLRRNEGMSAFIAALGAAYILRNTATIFWGHNPQAFPKVLPHEMINVSGIVVSTTSFMVLAIAIAVVGLFTLFLRKTRWGQAVLVVAQNRTTAVLMGIPVPLAITLVYALSGAIGMVGALLFATTTGALDPTVGFFITIQAFIAATIGGIGRIEGAILGGLLLGVLESLVVTYVSGLYADGIAWTILAIVLLFRPAGLLGRREVVKL